jgi:hypothetical protein
VRSRDLVTNARRTGASCFACILLATGATACSGDPGSENLHDGAGTTTRPAPTATPSPTAAATSGTASDAQRSQPVECSAVAEGCRCSDEGQVAACQSQRFDFGDYVTCSGVRQCVHGTWGACIPTHFVGH